MVGWRGILRGGELWLGVLVSGLTAQLSPGFLSLWLCLVVLCLAQSVCPFKRHCFHILFRIGNVKFTQLWKIIVESGGAAAAAGKPSNLLNHFLINISVGYTSVVFPTPFTLTLLVIWRKESVHTYVFVCVLWDVISRHASLDLSETLQQWMPFHIWKSGILSAS